MVFCQFFKQDTARFGSSYQPIHNKNGEPVNGTERQMQKSPFHKLARLYGAINRFLQSARKREKHSEQNERAKLEYFVLRIFA